jgi:Family of unknown function (DUF6152)
MKLSKTAMIVGILVVFAVPSLAHHSFSNFWYMDKTVEITGVVKALKLVNPHSEIAIEVTENGETSVWYITSEGTGSALRKGGWTPESLPVGMKVTIAGHPSRKEGAKALAAGKITKPDGSVIWFGGGGNVPQG